MYAELKRRVTERLRGLPKRPKRAVVLFLLDVFSILLLLLWSVSATTTSPLWQLFLAPHAINVVYTRLFGQFHMLGHAHIFPARDVTFWARVLLAVGAAGVQLCTMPGESHGNPRKLLNESHAVAHDEFPQRRGPCEHQCLHHIRGADMKNGECYRIAKMQGLLRIAHFETLHFWHRIQSYRWFQFSLLAVSDQNQPFVAILDRISMLWCYFIPNARWADIVASLVGTVAACALARAELLLPFSGVGGLCCYVLSLLLKQFFMPGFLELYYAQHNWDHEVDEDTLNTDWAKHTAETTSSLRGIEWNPICWGMSDASPSFTYHLEHTLFPSVNYLHLPKIADIVDATCAEFGVGCDVMLGGGALRRRWLGKLRKYAVSHEQ